MNPILRPLSVVDAALRRVPRPADIVRAGVEVPRAAVALTREATVVAAETAVAVTAGSVGLASRLPSLARTVVTDGPAAVAPIPGALVRTTRSGTLALAGNLQDAVVALGPRRRRVWTNGHRVHVELRRLGAEELAVLGPTIEVAVEDVPGVEWAEVNPFTHRVVVSLADPTRVAEVVAVVERAEAGLNLDEEPFGAADHPADRDQVGLATLELGVDAVALGASAIRRLRRGEHRPAAADLAQLVLALQYLPQVRALLEGRTRRPFVDLGVTVLASGIAVAGGRPVGPVIGLIEHGLRLHGANARYGAWETREPELCAKPSAAGLVRVPLPPRPPVPDGPMELAARWIPSGALAGAAASLQLLRNRERAAGILAAAAPRATRVGRTVFSDAIHHTLAHRGVVALDSSALDLLDRIDVAVFDAAVLVEEPAAVAQVLPVGDRSPAQLWPEAERLLDPYDVEADHEVGSWRLAPFADAATRRAALADHPGVAERAGRALGHPGTAVAGLHRRVRGGDGWQLAAVVVIRPRLRAGATAVLDAVRRAELEVGVVTDQPLVRAAIGADRTFEPGTDLVAAIRARQDDGALVWLTASGPLDALAAADLALGLPDPLGPPPWSADLLGNHLGDAVVVAEACLVARALSRQNAAISLAGSVGGAALAVTSQLPGAATRAAVAVEVAALVAAGNAARAAWQVDHLPVDLPPEPVPWHAFDVEEVLERTRTTATGLRSVEAHDRLPVPVRPPSTTALLARAVVEEAWNPLTPVLVTGAALSWLVGSPADAAAVALVIGLSSAIGGVERFRAERDVQALAAGEIQLVRARRDGIEVAVPSDELVVGDVIVLGPGERVPADCRLLEAESVEADESSLTGETALVAKRTEAVWATELTDHASVLYADSVLAVGRAVGIVVATGADTEVGRAAALAAAAGTRPSGLEANLERLTRITIPAAAVAGGGVGLVGLMRGVPMREMLTTGVSLAVAAVPEGLPLLATASELAAARRLAQHRVVVHQPATIEALGRTDVLLADKTGTLTEGRLSLVAVFDGAGTPDPGLAAAVAPVADRTVGPHGSDLDGTDLDGADPADRAAVAGPGADLDGPAARPVTGAGSSWEPPVVWRDVLRIAAWASPPRDGAEALHPTDAAFVAAAVARGIEDAPPARAALPFDPDRAYHATSVALADAVAAGLADPDPDPDPDLGSSPDLADTGSWLAVKGSPEVVLARSRWQHTRFGRRPLTTEARAALESTIERLAGEGHRILAVAGRRCSGDGTELVDTDVDDLTVWGLVALGDPVRTTASGAIGALGDAGVRVLMVTGDHPLTAGHVARAVGILAPDAAPVRPDAPLDATTHTLTGTDVDGLDDDELADVLGHVAVVARTTPAQKARIVRALQATGSTVAMVGDGANDTAAIRLADIGVAMGSEATSGARATADLLVLDDGLDRLVEAVGEGRAMWAAVQDAVGILLGHNLGEIAYTTIGSAVDGVPPLNGRQLLLVNLLTDVVPTMAVVLRPTEDDRRAELLAAGPRRGFDRELEDDLVTRALTTTAGATLGWLAARATGTPERARTVGLVSLVGTQLGQTLLVGGNNPSTWLATGGTAAFMVAVVQTPGVSQLFGCRPLGPVGWASAAGAAGAATAAQVFAPHLLDRFRRHLPAWPADAFSERLLGPGEPA